MKVAALDLGSNTFLLLIAEVSGGTITKVYRDELQVTRLGQGVHQNRKFHPDALLRARDCLRDYAKIIAEEKPERVLAMATSAARDVSNGEELFKIGREVGIPIEIIPGHQEAGVTFSGATFERKNRDGLAVIDVGGGSTEVIGKFAGGAPVGKSVDVGSVRLTEMFVTQIPTPTSELAKLRNYVREEFSKAKAELPDAKAVSEVIAVAGTPTTLAAVMLGRPFDDEIVHNYRISLSDLDLWTERIANMDLETRKDLPGMDPKRADVMPAGMVVLSEALRALNHENLTVSTRGVRYGVALLLADR